MHWEVLKTEKCSRWQYKKIVKNLLPKKKLKVTKILYKDTVSFILLATNRLSFLWIL
ncbi:hypothetical protein A9Y58_00702 [Streptococcus parauberis]|nr:hypothetical protein ASN87_01541 [Streptococcus parauberis]PCH13459.1 hypothetical protein A9Y58_00702 [Streptococcus parauberis]PNY20548.1 hypothetical protein ASN88_02220 [Streptococcus parauberis]